MSDMVEHLKYLSALPATEYARGRIGSYIAACANAAARIIDLEADNARLREALSSIDIYLTDTLTGRVLPDPATYKQWLVDGIREARNRARAALAGQGEGE